MNERITGCTPSVQRRWLVLIAGVVWLAVGMSLITVACVWLYASAWPLNLVLAAGSLPLGMIVYTYGFSRIVRKNIGRICARPERVCLFAFQGLRSYFLILLMMAMGYTVRHLPIPKYIDAVIYFTMGSALALGSSLYFREFSAQGRKA